MNSTNSIETTEFQQVQGIISLHRSKALQNMVGQIVQAASAQIQDAEIVQFETAQFPDFLNFAFTNLYKIINVCKTIEEKIFYVLYSY